MQAIRSSIDKRARSPRPRWEGWARWEGWEGIARAGLLVLACAFSGAGYAQQYAARNLAESVPYLVARLVNEGQLSGQKVYVGADDFFEEENELRPPLSKILRTMCLRALTDRQVKVALVPAEAVQVLHGRWRRESETHLHLTLFIADPPRDQDEEPVATRSADALVPVESLRPKGYRAHPPSLGGARGAASGEGLAGEREVPPASVAVPRSRTRRCPRSLARTFWAAGGRRSRAATGSRSSAPPSWPRVWFTATYLWPVSTSRSA